MAAKKAYYGWEEVVEWVEAKGVVPLLAFWVVFGYKYNNGVMEIVIILETCFIVLVGCWCMYWRSALDGWTEAEGEMGTWR